MHYIEFSRINSSFDNRHTTCDLIADRLEQVLSQSNPLPLTPAASFFSASRVFRTDKTSRSKKFLLLKCASAVVAELADAPALGAGG
jgi:hypothetical protein